MPQVRTSRLTLSEWSVAIFTAIYMVISAIAALVGGNGEFVFYLVVMVILIAAVLLLHFRVGLASVALWGLSLWGLLHMAGGLWQVPESWPVKGDSHVLYNLWLVPGWLKYDQFVHAYGFGLVTWVCWQSLQRAFTRLGHACRPTWGLVVLCLMAGMGFGALNEVVEFMATLTIPETNVGGYENTGWDLVANTIGAGLAGLGIKTGLLR